jgi:hypothetical protein
MDDRLVWFGVVVLLVVVVIGVVLWAGGERPSWGDSQMSFILATTRR